jgi:hypothetical protein
VACGESSGATTFEKVIALKVEDEVVATARKNKSDPPKEDLIAKRQTQSSSTVTTLAIERIPVAVRRAASCKTSSRLVLSDNLRCRVGHLILLVDEGEGKTYL